MTSSSSLRSPEWTRIVELLQAGHVILLGEASHGTHEYYDVRARLTLEIVRRVPVRFVAVEADWPDAYLLNRYVRGLDRTTGTREVLSRLSRWPTWMWANEEVAEFGDALRRINEGRPHEAQVGFYGLDLYSLRESLARIQAYLRSRDGALLETARRAFECLEPGFRGKGTPWVPEECEDDVLELLAGLQRRPRRPGDAEDEFDAELNAWAALGAHRYYRSLLGGDNSWNVRDQHMQETLERLRRRHGADAVGIVWAHNTHVGDARATDMADEGLVNLGQLARQRWGHEVRIAGLGSYEGHVVAARAWESQPQNMRSPPARRGSLEHLLHSAGRGDQWLDLGGSEDLWRDPIGHRAVGVVYHPEAEGGNYVPTRLAERYDAFIFLDRTHALRPLHGEPLPDAIPQTIPFGE